MSSFLQPDPVLLAFVAIKEWVYLTVLMIFGLIRAPLARGRARHAAIIGLILTAIFVAGVTLPPIFGWSSGVLYRAGGMVGGMGVPLTCSLPFLAAAVLPGRRFWGLDLAHLLWFGGLIALWIYSVIS